jgi:hypothetical protein
MKDVPDLEPDDPDNDLRVCNCSRCDCLLMAAGQPRRPYHPEVVAGRVYGRPHCRRCLPHAVKEPRPVRNRFTVGRDSA